MAIPAIANGLKVIKRIIKTYMRFLCFHKESYITKIGREKSIIGALAPFAGCHTTFNFNFLLVRIGLCFVVDVPAQRDPKLIDEVFARVRLIVTSAQVKLLVLLENLD